MILVIFLLFSSLFFSINCNDWKIDLNSTDHKDFLEIRKCCQIGEVLDSWYKCTPAEDVHDMFMEELSYLIGDTNQSVEDALTVVPRFQCPRSKIREYIVAQLHPDGYLDVIENVFQNINSSSNDYYCIEVTEIHGELEGIHAIFCNQNRAGMLGDENMGFLTKCCPHGKVLDGYFDDCVDLPEGYSDRDWIPPRRIHSELSARPTGQYFVNISNFPDICEESEVLDVAPEYFLTNGQVALEENETYSHTHYACIDRVLLSESEATDAMVLICEFKDRADGDVNRAMPCKSVNLGSIYTFFGVISIICLLVTLAVYLKIPTLKNLHGKIVINNIISILATTLLFLAILNRQAVHHDDEKLCKNLDKSCAIKGYLLYYFSIAMFCWMSVMCFDLSWRFIRVRLPSQGSEKKKLWSYSACCWGLPLVFLLFAAACQLLLPHESNFNPNIGCDQCFIHSEGNRLLIFFHLPIFFMIIANIIGFVITAHSMYKAKSGTKKASLSRRTNSMRQSTTDKRKSGRRKSMIPEKALNQDTLEQLMNYLIVYE